MKKGIAGNIIILLFSILALVTQMSNFWNVAIFSDEHNTNPGAIYGGDMWTIMQWVVMALLLVVIIIAAVQLIKAILK